MNQPSKRLDFLLTHLELPEAVGDPDARWEIFQFQFFNNSSLLTIDSKARQVGWSWTAAADAVAESVLAPRTTNIFVSINQDEAKEKVRYARQIIEALDADVRPKLLHDNELYIELKNGSRLISHPCRPVRGKAKARVFLDEFAHYPKDKEIYASALPTTTRGGELRVGSSPLGASGVFWEIYAQQLKAYPGFRRRVIPWWYVGALCANVEEAQKIAAHMTTEERVRLFGTQRLKEIYENIPLEDFQQEYECAWVDESVAWITWDEIKRNQALAQEGKLWHRQVRNKDDALRAIDEVAEACHRGEIESVLAGGMDVGRKKDLTEMVFVGKGTTGQLPYRLGISLAGVKFDDQMLVACKALDVLPVTQFLIDQNGIGMQIAEQLHDRYYERAQGVTFTNASKELWAVEVKVRAQRGELPIPLERDFVYQVHSIKKMITAGKNVSFDTAANEKHHADKFWGWALAVWGAKSPIVENRTATARARAAQATMLR